jgi:hypothetical protein
METEEMIDPLLSKFKHLDHKSPNICHPESAT